MTTDQSRKFIQEYFSAMSNDKSEATIDKYVSDEHLKCHIIVFETGMPNYQVIAQDIVAEGNKVAVRIKVEGVHKGELFGQPATGRKVEVDGIIIYEVKDYKIVNHWIQADSVALMQQISGMVESDSN